MNRLFKGYDDQLCNDLVQGNQQNGQTPQDAKQNAKAALKKYEIEPVEQGMPLPDAIGLARFMVETTEGYVRYRLGADTVGGPVEVTSAWPTRASSGLVASTTSHRH